jgi:hypothetical protein
MTCDQAQKGTRMNSSLSIYGEPFGRMQSHNSITGMTTNDCVREHSVLFLMFADDYSAYIILLSHNLGSNQLRET